MLSIAKDAIFLDRSLLKQLVAWRYRASATQIRFPLLDNINGDFYAEMNFEGIATWKGGTECTLSLKAKNSLQLVHHRCLAEKKATAYLKTFSLLP